MQKLRNADAAGDTYAAKRFAAMIRQLPAEEQPEQSGLDKAVAASTEFAEGATGWGTELGAFGSQLGASVYDLLNSDKSAGEILDNFGGEALDRAYDRIRGSQDKFEEENPLLSDAAAVGGMISGLAIPGAALMKGGKLAKTEGIAGEGALYGAGTDDGDRGGGAAIGAGVGSAAAVALPKLVTKFQEMRAGAGTAEEMAEVGGEMVAKQTEELGS